MEKAHLNSIGSENPLKASMKVTPHDQVVCFRKEAKKGNRYIYFKFIKDGANLMECPVWFKNLAEKYLILESGLFDMDYIKDNKENPKSSITNNHADN